MSLLIDSLADKQIWGIFVKSTKAEIKKGKGKYTPATFPNKPDVFRCNNRDLCVTKPQAKEIMESSWYKRRKCVLMMSLQFASTELGKTLNVYDIDGEKSEFDSKVMDELLADDTYIEQSPSGEGYHIFYIVPEGTRLSKIDGVGYDILSNVWVSMTDIVYKDSEIMELSTDSHYLKFTGSEPEPRLTDSDSGSGLSLADHIKVLTSGVGEVHKSQIYYSSYLRKGGLDQPETIHQINTLLEIWKGTIDPGDEAEMSRCTIRIKETKGIVEGAQVEGIVIPQIVEQAEVPVPPTIDYPESISMIRENLGKPIKDQINEFFDPFVSSFNSVILNGKIVTPLYQRIPTILELVLGLSTAGKDLNSSVPLKVFSQQDWPREIEAYIKNISNPPGGITSDTAIMQFLETHDETLLWLVTECGDNIKKMTKGGNASMEAMQESIKFIYDGHKLSPTFKVQDTKTYGKNMFSGNVKTIEFPNVSLAWYTQTKNFFPLVSLDMLTGGFAGRFNYNILSQKVKRISVYDESSGAVNNVMDKDFIGYISKCISKCKNNSERVVCSLDKDASQLLLEFDHSLDREDENLDVFIKRVAMSIEKELTVWAGHESIWKGGDPRITKDMVEAILPKYEHQVKIREGFVFDRVGEGLAQIRENGIETVLTEMLNEGLFHILSYSKNLAEGGEHRIAEMLKKGFVPKNAINQRLIKLPDFKLTTAAEQNPAWLELERANKIYVEKNGRAQFVRFV